MMYKITTQEVMKGHGGSVFHMILLAAQRAKQIQQGATPKVKCKETSPALIALEEIAAGYGVEDFVEKKDEDDGLED